MTGDTLPEVEAERRICLIRPPLNRESITHAGRLSQ